MSRPCLLLFAVFATVTLLNAQVATTVSGTVVDATRAVVPQAKVSLRLPGSETDLYVATTTSSGGYTLPNVNPGTYDLAVDAKGFQKKVVYQGLLVSPGRTTDVPPIQIEVAAIEQTVYVQAAEGAQTSTAEVSFSLTRMQIEDMPIRGQNPMMPVLTLPGVHMNQGSMMIINGNKPAYPNVTLDGIGIIDNYIRNNPYEPFVVDQVAAVTVSTSNQSSAAYGGSSQVTFVTPSGTNDYHGKLYFWNRASALAANGWFINQARNPKPFQNENRMGGSVGGKVLPDKLFFYTAYEAVRQRLQASQNATVLTSDARNGIFTYQSGGTVRKVNILEAAGVQPDPVTQTLLSKVPTPDKINNFNVGDSSAALLRNTAGYNFQKRNNSVRDYVTAKIDYVLSSRQSFSVTGLWNHGITDAPSSDTTFDPIPSVQNDTSSKLLSSSWRWSPRPTLTNELRFGFYMAPDVLRASQDIPNFFVTGTVYTNPVLTTRTEGRQTDTYNIADNASYLRGAHSVQFGVQNQRVRVEQFADFGTSPSYTLGIGTGNPSLTAAQLPGISANDLNAANSLLATLAGYYTSYSQTFNVTSPTSGYVNGAGRVRHYTGDNYALYIQDTWKILRRLTANIGVRWDYLTVVDERDSLALFPVVENNDPIHTLLSNATLDFTGKSTGRPFYNPDKNNFAPNLGLAWDVLGNGKTLLRAGYSVAFVNDNLMAAASATPVVVNNSPTNVGLTSTAMASGLSGRLGAGVPAIPIPAYKVPRTFADNYAVNRAWGPTLTDPNLVTPYVQQWNIAVQQDIRGVIVEVRYVGNHGTKELRGIDVNQVVIGDMLPDFLKAQSNGFLSQKANPAGGFDPRFNANIPGSQPLPFFDQLPNGGNLNLGTVINLIRTGEAGELANTYQTNNLNGQVNFFRNPTARGAFFITNISNNTYNALQAQAAYRFLRGLQIEANYTYSRALGDADGNGATNNEPYLDNNNPQNERSRGSYIDLTHVFKATGSYDLPLDRLPWSHPIARKVLEGWTFAGIFNFQTGQPFSILSSRGTVNRRDRSMLKNTVNTILNKSQLDDLIQFRMTDTGPYIIAASAIGPDGRGTAPDGAEPFAGQVFFNPAAGTSGTLQKHWFSAPAVWTLDTKIAKTTPIGEKQSIELRLVASNVFNHPNFFIGTAQPNQDINSPTFGKITGTRAGISTTNRQLQLSLNYRF